MAANMKKRCGCDSHLVICASPSSNGGRRIRCSKCSMTGGKIPTDTKQMFPKQRCEIRKPLRTERHRPQTPGSLRQTARLLLRGHGSALSVRNGRRWRMFLGGKVPPPCALLVSAPTTTTVGRRRPTPAELPPSSATSPPGSGDAVRCSFHSGGFERQRGAPPCGQKGKLQRVNVIFNFH